MADIPILTTSQLMAASAELLSTGGYRAASLPTDGPAASRVFEDPYGIVAVVVYDSWAQLVAEWHEAQGWLVDLISLHLSRPEPKAWEGYLVLLTPGLVPPADRPRLVELRYDTNRVRKLVATGDDLVTLEGVRQALLPLLPLTSDIQPTSSSGLLDRLPELLEGYGIPTEATRTVVQAFAANESLIERLHASRGRT